MRTRRLNSQGKLPRPHSTPPCSLDSSRPLSPQPTKKRKQTNCASSSIPFIPEVRLTKQDMLKDPLQLVEKLQLQYREYGAVKLVAAPGWKPPLSLNFALGGVTTRIQRLHELRFGKPFQEKKDAYTLENYRMMALDFERSYKPRLNPLPRSKALSKPLLTLHQIEREYWTHVNSEPSQILPQNRISVEYAADLPAERFGSGFPTSKCRYETAFDYVSSPYNLNNLRKSPRSLLKSGLCNGEHIGGVTTPWVYVGMLFASFCWHVEDCSVHSLNYSHCGSAKVWYIIPESDRPLFEDYANKKSRGKCLPKITLMLDPEELKLAGIKVYKTYQHPGEFICTLFGAYHCGFSAGFNIGQAANFVIPTSLPYLRSPLRPSPFSYQCLVVRNSSGLLKDDVAEQYKLVLQQQRDSLKKVKKSGLISESELAKEGKFDKWSCKACKQYVWLSYMLCSECQHIYCLAHAEDCCGIGLKLMLLSPNEERAYVLPIMNS